jgi:hypothetical protein
MEFENRIKILYEETKIPLSGKPPYKFDRLNFSDKAFVIQYGAEIYKESLSLRKHTRGASCISRSIEIFVQDNLKEIRTSLFD